MIDRNLYARKYRKTAKYKQWLIDNKEKWKEYHKKYSADWYLRNKEKVDKRNAEYAIAHPDRILAAGRRYAVKNREELIARGNLFSKSMKGRYRFLVYRHNKRKWPEQIMSLAEFIYISNKPCVYCDGQSNYGIDRVDNEKGYSLSNSSPCCELCNHMKWKISKENFLSHIKKIHDHNLEN